MLRTLQRVSISHLVARPYSIEMHKNIYEALKAINGKGLTYAEKILHAHGGRGDGYLTLKPDRVAMQDASAQTAVLQFMLSGLTKTRVPSSIHCDHLIVANKDAVTDVKDSIKENSEVYDFLQSAAQKYGIAFWKPGKGIIHQIVLENYAFPGGLMIGTDSHTPNGGGLGMIAIGVGGADAVDAMAGIGWELKRPKILGVHLKGRLQGWTSPKDIILYLAGKLSVKGGTGRIIEYFGPGVETLSCTGMATICNMGAEVGATTSLFPYTESMSKYLRATRREDQAELADLYGEYLRADKDAKYEEIIEIDLNTLEPHINGPSTPDLATKISQMATHLSSNDYPSVLSAALLGSCTNSSYADLTRASNVAKQALNKGLKSKCELLVTPGSEMIRSTMERDGIQDIFEQFGGKILANACGPCIGQWARRSQPKNSIITSFNRNFTGRNDGNPNTLHFIGSPEMVIAMAIAGRLDFDPRKDPVYDDKGRPFMLEPPTGDILPPRGFSVTESYLAPPEDGSKIEVAINPKSDRLQKLNTFPAWNGKDFEKCAILVKVKGKCTTDHISPAGKWLKYKGHLENISNCTLIGALNADLNEVNKTVNIYTGEKGSIPDVAKQYRKNGKPWVVIADENYGEGSAREHAALQPRYLGCVAIISRSFARIHETNLKKQGVLPLTFTKPSDYDLVSGSDTISILGLKDLTPGKPLTMIIHSKDGDKTISVQHTLNEGQIEWFKDGSALNSVAKKVQV
jgi:aconitate hydratase